jgi:APA family basic amino acid/polyamine antiporter
VPLVPILAILFSSVLIIGLSAMTQIRLVVWLIIGLIIYFTYGRRNSKVQRAIEDEEIGGAREGSMAD